MAQLVERRLGKAEVTGSNPVSSFWKPLILLGLRQLCNREVIKKVIRHMSDYLLFCLKLRFC